MYLASLPDQYSLRNQSPHVLHIADVSDEESEGDQALDAGVHVAPLGWVWKPDTQTQHVRIHINTQNKTHHCQTLCVVFMQIYLPEPGLLTSQQPVVTDVKCFSPTKRETQSLMVNKPDRHKAVTALRSGVHIFK